MNPLGRRDVAAAEREHAANGQATGLAGGERLLDDLEERLRVGPGFSAEILCVGEHDVPRLADAVDDDGHPLAPDADPARWWGVREPTGTRAPAGEGPIRLSPSQVESLLTCPRKYFLAREARAEPPREIRTILGSVIHAVAERAASGELGPGDVDAALDGVWADIPFPAAGLSLPR